MSKEIGQATVEALAAIPMLLLAGSVALQFLLAGYTLTLVDGASEAGALALAGGRPAVSAVKASLPAWAVDRAAIEVRGGKVTVRLSPPSLISLVAERLAVTSSSYARPVSK